MVYNAQELHFAIVQNSPQLAIHQLRQLQSGQSSFEINERLQGITALSLSLYHNDNVTFCAIIELFAGIVDLNAVSIDSKGREEPPLVTACRSRNRDAVERLVEAGCNIDATDNYNCSALWMCVRQRDIDLAEYLLLKGARLDISDQWNQSPLFLAVRHSRVELARMLILHGSNVNVNENAPPIRHVSGLFYFALNINEDFEIARLLIHAGYNVSREHWLRRRLFELDSNDPSAAGKVNGLLGKHRDELLHEMANPPPLQRIAAVAVRRHLATVIGQRSILERIQLLPLPKAVRQALLNLDY